MERYINTELISEVRVHYKTRTDTRIKWLPEYRVFFNLIRLFKAGYYEYEQYNPEDRLKGLNENIHMMYGDLVFYKPHIEFWYNNRIIYKRYFETYEELDDFKDNNILTKTEFKYYDFDNEKFI